MNEQTFKVGDRFFVEDCRCGASNCTVRGKTVTLQARTETGNWLVEGGSMLIMSIATLRPLQSPAPEAMPEYRLFEGENVCCLCGGGRPFAGRLSEVRKNPGMLPCEACWEKHGGLEGDPHASMDAEITRLRALASPSPTGGGAEKWEPRVGDQATGVTFDGKERRGEITNLNGSCLLGNGPAINDSVVRRESLRPATTQPAPSLPKPKVEAKAPCDVCGAPVHPGLTYICEYCNHRNQEVEPHPSDTEHTNKQRREARIAALCVAQRGPYDMVGIVGLKGAELDSSLVENRERQALNAEDNALRSLAARRQKHRAELLQDMSRKVEAPKHPWNCDEGSETEGRVS